MLPVITKERIDEIYESLLVPISEKDYSILAFKNPHNTDPSIRVHGSPMQSKPELLWLCKKIHENTLEYGSIVTALEIGTCDGGGLKMWEQLMWPNKNSMLISLDINSHILWDYKNSPVNIQIITGNSRDESTRQRVKDVLGGRKLDFLFIDGNHTTLDASLDMIEYGGFVAPNRIIAFHDTRLIRSWWDDFTGGGRDVKDDKQAEETSIFHKEEYKNTMGCGIFYNLPNQNVIKYKE